eukprot:3492778-Pyramimonas_sp.AAC.2
MARRAVKEATGADGVNVIQNNGAAAGQVGGTFGGDTAEHLIRLSQGTLAPIQGTLALSQGTLAVFSRFSIGGVTFVAP